MDEITESLLGHVHALKGLVRLSRVTNAIFVNLFQRLPRHVGYPKDLKD